MSDWRKVFVIIWSGQLLSTLSSNVVGYAVVFWLSIETKSAEVLAFATIATLLPQLLIGPFTGVMIDRWNRQRTMIISDIFIAILSLLMAFMFASGNVSMPLIYLLLILRSIGSSFHVPAMQASVPLLAPETELLRISGINQMIYSVSTIAGPALAALLINVFSMTWVMLFDVFGAVAAIITLMMVHIPDPQKVSDTARNILSEMKEGIDEIFKRQGLRWLFIFIVLAMFFIMPVAALFPLMTINHFGGGTYQMSIVEVAWGIGMLAGGGLVQLKKLMFNEILLIFSMFIILGITFLFTGILPVNGFWIFAVLTGLGGISMSIYSAAFVTILQKLIDPSKLGRVFSIYGSLTMLPSMFGLLQTGYIADTIGVPLAFVISGAAIILTGTGAFFIPAIRRTYKVSNVS